MFAVVSLTLTWAGSAPFVAFRCESPAQRLAKVSPAPGRSEQDAVESINPPCNDSSWPLERHAHHEQLDPHPKLPGITTPSRRDVRASVQPVSDRASVMPLTAARPGRQSATSQRSSPLHRQGSDRPCALARGSRDGRRMLYFEQTDAVITESATPGRSDCTAAFRAQMKTGRPAGPTPTSPSVTGRLRHAPAS